MASAVYRTDGTLVGHVAITATDSGAVTAAQGNRTWRVGQNTGEVSEGSEGENGRVIGGVTDSGQIIRGGSQEGYGWSGGEVVGHVSASGAITDRPGARVGNVSPPIPHKEPDPLTGSSVDFHSNLKIRGGAALALLF